MAFEELLERAGGVGRFQVLQVFTLLLPAVLTPCHLLLENFSAAIPGHRCWVHILDNGSQVLTNLTHEAFLAVSIPPGPNQQPHHCLRFQEPQWQLLDPNATAANWSEAATEPCMDGWVYDRSTFTSTVVTTLSCLLFQWDLVCSSQRLKPMGQSIFMAGILAGAFIWGLLSYRIGRKPMLSWCCLQMAVSSTGAIFAPNFLIYCGLRFLSAFGLAGIIMTQGTLMAEWTTTHRRAVALTILGCTYSTGQMALAGLAFALRDWRDLQLVVSVPLLAISLISWWLPESARWLIITGKVDQALRELKKVAKINGHKEAKKTLTTEVVMASMEEEMASAKAHGSVKDLFCVPELCGRTCAMLVLLRDVLLLWASPGPAESGQGHLPPAGPLRSCGLRGQGHQRRLPQVLGTSFDSGGLPGPGRLLHPGQRARAPRSADPACGAGRAGERLFWSQLDLPHRVQGGALPDSIADDSRWFPAVGRPPRGSCGPPAQDYPAVSAPAATTLLWCCPHCRRPGSPALPPRNSGTSTA
ncbi:solute carrier family 22 member 11 isoform X6 [Castor canadensis]|uniref:Solute carrier family 22 member 11 isoform X6 n=1 Tax=Castor canadensis TaxID=51338 RepID=A0AC58KIK9_CASCN